MKIYKAIIVLLLFEFLLPGTYYYSEDFSQPLNNPVNPEWITNFWYGRLGTVIGLDSKIIQRTNNGNLLLSGYPSANCDRDGTWKGKYVYNTNKYAATKEQPFGIEIIKKWSLMDTSIDNSQWGTNANDSRHQSEIGISLFVGVV